MHADIAQVINDRWIVFVFYENIGDNVFDSFCKLNASLGEQLLDYCFDSLLLVSSRKIKDCLFNVFLKSNEELAC